MKIVMLFMLICNFCIGAHANTICNEDKKSSEVRTNESYCSNLDCQELLSVCSQLKNIEIRMKAIELSHSDILNVYDPTLEKLQSSKIRESISKSESSIDSIKDSMLEVESDIVSLKGMMRVIEINDNHNDWAGWMLGAASLIITGLSFSIAILAFWGYKSIRSKAIEQSVKISREIIISKIESGELDDIVYKAVEKAIYRDILSLDDFPENADEIR